MAEAKKPWWREVYDLVFATFTEFSADHVPRIAAAMSYFLLLAVAPLLLFVNAIAQLIGRQVMPGSAADKLASASATASAPVAQAASWAGSYAPYVAIFIVIFGAVSVFSQFVDAIGIVWKTESHRTPARQFLRHHGLSFALLGVMALGLLVAVIVGGLVSAFGRLALSIMAQVGLEVPSLALVFAVRTAFVFVVALLLFWVAFTVVPDRKLGSLEVLPGALITAVLFAIGETWLGYYLGHTERFSIFGAFGLFVVLIVWIYYSALVALWGAELTRLLVLRADTRREGRAVNAS